MSDKKSNSDFKQTLDLLAEGDKQIILDYHKNIVLVLGNTGSGKTTLTHLLAGNNDDLISREIGEDTGEFVIDDLNDKISKNSTILSKTLFPEMIVDQATDTVFYDCPGFSDTRSSSIDIANTYFIHKLIDHADRVKLLFVVNHNSVKQGMDRIDFMRLTKHATTFIKNVDKFQGSIGLIATKVENSYTVVKKQLTLVSDIKIINNIANFLKSTKITLQENSDWSKEQTENAIKFIDTLLLKDSEANNYSRIALFRRPDSNGKLSEIELIQDGKKVMNKMIHNFLKFTEENKEDFGYTISEESKNFIVDLTEEINSDISLNVDQVANKISQYFEQEEKCVTDVQDFSEKLDNVLDKINKNIGIINKESTTKDLIEMINSMNIPDTESHLNHILKFEQYFDFLQLVSTKTLTYRQFDWIRPFESIEKKLNVLKKVYIILITVYSKLSEFNTQNNLLNYDINILKNQINDGLKNTQPLGITIKPFLDNIYTIDKWPDYIKSLYDEINMINIDDIKAKYLFEIVDTTLNRTVIEEFSNEKYSIRGDFIRLSKVLDSIKSYSKKNLDLQIFSTNSFFIDEDFVKIGDEINLKIIAPKWEVINSKKIILNGNDGINHENQIANIDHVGEPGRTGGSAGTFFGIGEHFSNMENLIVHANGGNGGNGQNGGDGSHGKNGQSSQCSKSYCYNYERSKVTNYNDFFVGFKKTIWWYGYDGQNGSNGKDGGAPGFGGEGGEIEIHDATNLSSKTTAQLSQLDGNNGLKGNGGIGGEPGKRGQDCYLENLYIVIFENVKTGCRDSNQKSYARRGENGRAGENFVGLKYPSRNHIENIDIFKDDYIGFVQTKPITVFNKRSLNRFGSELKTEKYPLENRGKRLVPHPMIMKSHQSNMFLTANSNISDSNSTNLKEIHNTNGNIPNNKIQLGQISFTTLNSTLALADVILRKFTGVKDKFQKINEESRYSTALAMSLNIVDVFEKMLKQYGKKTGNESVEININGPATVGIIQNLIINNNKILDILKVLVDKGSLENMSADDKIEFASKLQKKISKILNN